MCIWNSVMLRSYDRERQGPLLLLISPLCMMVVLNLPTTRCWSAPAGCTFTNFPSTFRSATSPSSLSYTLVRPCNMMFVCSTSLFQHHMFFFVKPCSFILQQWKKWTFSNWAPLQMPQSSHVRWWGFSLSGCSSAWMSQTNLLSLSILTKVQSF